MPKNFTGLTSEEALKKLKEFGPNEIKELVHVSPLKILVRQVRSNFIVYLLLLASLISFFIGEPITGIAILAVIFLVIVTGFIQEYRAEKAITALKQMIMPVSLVLRDGAEAEIASLNLVPGDVVILRSGERVPADCILLEEKNIKVDESILTGESREVEKKVAIADYSEENMLFMGSYIVDGRGIAKVVHTGMNTRFGSIAGMISTAEKELPLQNKINYIARFMVYIGIVISLLTGSLMLLRAPILSAEVLTNTFILMIALSVAVFPEGFPLVLMATLAAGASRMAKENAIVNRMSIIETLGETTVICSDKTGTLTKGEMTVRKTYLPSGELMVSGVGYEGVGDFLIGNRRVNVKEDADLATLIKAAVVCNDAKIERTGEDEHFRIIGNPTEGALLIMAAKAGVFKDDLSFIRQEESPFSSERKMMSVFGKEGDGYFIFAKGAPEVLLKKCKFIQKDGQVVSLTDQAAEKILGINKKMTADALRTLALAFKAVKNSQGYQEEGLVFLGLVGMEDPPRQEVFEALAVCRNAGISVKMITGDHKETASAIARQIGLSGKLIEGQDLDRLSDDELKNIAADTVIFARVRPEHKIRIVRALKQNGEIVAMTGDGVNDAPALKEAHIGVAMGMGGTDVSRSVADLTLKDDNFATIVAAVKEGRTIFNNIRKFVSYELSCNFAELFVLFIGVLLAPLFGWQIPILVALQILFMNLVTDNLPSITLGFNPPSYDIMKNKPRRKSAILNSQLILLIILTGILMGSLALAVFYLSYNIFGYETGVARTTALVALILLEIVAAFQFRSFRYRVLNRSLFVNKYLFYASVTSILLTLMIVYLPVNTVFDTYPLNLGSWLNLLIAPIVMLIIFDIAKVVEQNRVLDKVSELLT